MKKLILLILTISFLSSCRQSFKVDNYYTKAEQDSLMLKILPYIAKKPKGVQNGADRFLTRFDDYYKAQLPKFSFQHYYIGRDSIHYFTIYKIAPSLYQKKIAIGGYLRLNKNGDITELEELYNTPKMKLEELDKKSKELFEEMTISGNVESFIGNDEYVEFPDKRCYYDKSANEWKMRF